MQVIKVGQRLEVKPIDAALLRRVAGEAIISTQERVQQRQLGSSDTPMRGYSLKGPIYVPITGPGRTKTSLAGRPILTPKDLRRARVGGIVIARTSSRKSAKFPNYAAYKKALGKTGQRDLELSGSMLRAITIVRIEKNAVVIGFTRDDERKKAEGNEKIDHWFELSPSDQARVIAVFEQAYGVPVRVAT